MDILQSRALVKKIMQSLQANEVFEASSALDRLLAGGYKNFNRLNKIAGDFLRSYSKHGVAATIKTLEYVFANSTGDAYSDAAYILGVLYYQNYQFEKADEYFSAPCFDKSPKPLSYRLYSAIAQNKLEQAEQLIETGKTLWENNPDQVYGKVSILSIERKYEFIRSCYIEYLKQAPDLACSNYLFALYLSDWEGNYQQARIQLEKALNLLKTDRYKNHYGYYLPTENLFDDLRKKYLDTLKNLHEVEKISALLSTSEYEDLQLIWEVDQLWEQKEWSQCIHLLSGLYETSAGRQDKRYYAYLLGETYLFSDQLDQAKDAYLEAIEIGEAIWMPEIDEFVNVFLCQPLDHARIDSTYLDKALELDRIVTIKTLITKLIALGSYNAAIFYSQNYRQELEDTLFLNNYLGKAYMELNEDELAIKYFDMAVEVLPTHVWAMEMLYLLYQRNGHHLKAKEITDRLIKIRESEI
jgi:tetratricopeptide (TPR) repeat protein